MITTTINIDVPNEFNSDLNDRFRDFFGRVIADIKYGLNSDDSTNICGQYELEIAEMLHTALVKGDVTTSVAENDITIKNVHHIEKIDETDFFNKVKGGDIERCFAFNVYNGEITLLSDMENCEDNYKKESMRFKFPADWADMDIVKAAVDVRGQYAGGININEYDSKDDTIYGFIGEFAGLYRNYYSATDNVKLSTLKDLPDGIAYIYFEPSNQNQKREFTYDDIGFYDLIEQNHREFLEELENGTVQDAIKRAYEIVVKDNIFAYVENTDLDLSKEQYTALMSSENPLDEIYETFLEYEQFHTYNDIGDAIEETARLMQESLDRKKADKVLDSFGQSENNALDLVENKNKGL